MKREKDDNPFFDKPIPLPDLTVHQTCKKPSACKIATSSFLAVSSSSSNKKTRCDDHFLTFRQVLATPCLWSMHWDTILGPMGGWSFLDISSMQWLLHLGVQFSPVNCKNPKNDRSAQSSKGLGFVWKCATPIYINLCYMVYHHVCYVLWPCFMAIHGYTVTHVQTHWMWPSWSSTASGRLD